MATQAMPHEVHLRRTLSQEASAKQRELFLFFRGLTFLVLFGFCIAVPIYIYSAHVYSPYRSCNVPLGSWQWSLTIFLWIMLAAFVIAYLFQRVLQSRSSPGNVAFLPALVLYIATAAWLIYGTVLIATAKRSECDSTLWSSTLGVVIASWSCFLLLGLVQGLASLFMFRRAPKAGGSTMAPVAPTVHVAGTGAAQTALPIIARRPYGGATVFSMPEPGSIPPPVANQAGEAPAVPPRTHLPVLTVAQAK